MILSKQKTLVIYLFALFATVSLSPVIYSQQTEPVTDSALELSIALETQALNISEHKNQYGVTDPELVGLLTQLSDTQSLLGEYSAAIRSLEEAFEISRINLGLYHAAQIDIVDKLIANETFLENWIAVTNYYGWQEHLHFQLYDMDDPRLELGLDKVTSWHMSAFSENIDNESQKHLQKARDLLIVRLEVIDNVVGNTNPRYVYLSGVLESIQEILRSRNYDWVRGPRNTGLPAVNRVETM